ncbi:DUF421 domain-containing protein [Cytobacillus sp. FJAT-54145]|uniref:DUF421 domain-containing protein n=1 Tax=Cytobacillus spartinae TaxID=3299023 RepID=A0ABW6KIW2_9BACI
MGVWELITRLVLSFIVLLALTRIMGRKEISQMTFFNLVSAISIGTIGGSLVINNELSIRNGVIALVGWAAITIIVGFIDINSKKFRKVIEGDPLIVIKNGQIMEKALRRTRLDVDALNAMLREKNTFSIKDVEYAIFETDGRLSVMRKDMKQPLTASDMNITKPQNVYPILSLMGLLIWRI